MFELNRFKVYHMLSYDRSTNDLKAEHIISNEDENVVSLVTSLCRQNVLKALFIWLLFLLLTESAVTSEAEIETGSWVFTAFRSKM